MAETASYVLCVRNDGYPVSLELRRVYRSIHDPLAESRGLRRVIDESKEPYLYPASFFVAIELPPEAVEILNASRDG